MYSAYHINIFLFKRILVAKAATCFQLLKLFFKTDPMIELVCLIVPTILDKIFKELSESWLLVLSYLSLANNQQREAEWQDLTNLIPEHKSRKKLPFGYTLLK